MDLGCYIAQKWNGEGVSGMLEWILVRDMLCAKSKVIWNLQHYEEGKSIKEKNFIAGRPATP